MTTSEIPFSDSLYYELAIPWDSPLFPYLKACYDVPLICKVLILMAIMAIFFWLPYKYYRITWVAKKISKYLTEKPIIRCFGSNSENAVFKQKRKYILAYSKYLKFFHPKEEILFSTKDAESFPPELLSKICNKARKKILRQGILSLIIYSVVAALFYFTGIVRITAIPVFWFALAFFQELSSYSPFLLVDNSDFYLENMIETNSHNDLPLTYSDYERWNHAS